MKRLLTLLTEWIYAKTFCRDENHCIGFCKKYE